MQGVLLGAGHVRKELVGDDVVLGGGDAEVVHVPYAPTCVPVAKGSNAPGNDLVNVEPVDIQALGADKEGEAACVAVDQLLALGRREGGEDLEVLVLRVDLGEEGLVVPMNLLHTNDGGAASFHGGGEEVELLLGEAELVVEEGASVPCDQAEGARPLPSSCPWCHTAKPTLLWGAASGR